MKLIENGDQKNPTLLPTLFWFHLEQSRMPKVGTCVLETVILSGTSWTFADDRKAISRIPTIIYLPYIL